MFGAESCERRFNHGLKQSPTIAIEGTQSLKLLAIIISELV